MTTQKTTTGPSTTRAPEFTLGQLVSVDWDKLGEITEVLADGLYRVWVESDGSHSDAVIVHYARLEAIR